MALVDTLALPLFEDGHRRFADDIARWADARLPSLPQGQRRPSRTSHAPALPPQPSAPVALCPYPFEFLAASW